MTQSRRFVFIAALLLGCAGATQVQAQFRGDAADRAPMMLRSLPGPQVPATPPPSVLSPDPSVWWIGPQIGASLVAHGGDFITDYCNCAFDNGSGAGVAVGIELGHMFSPMFGVAVKAVYNDMGADYSHKIMQEAWVPELNQYIPAEHERRNRVDLGYFMLHSALQFHPFSGFYVFLGPGVGFTTTGNTTYTLAVTDERFYFDIGDPEARTIEEDSGEIPGLETLRLDARIGAGANIRLGRSFLLSPEVSYSLPLSTISSDDDWKAEAIQLIAVFKFEL